MNCALHSLLLMTDISRVRYEWKNYKAEDVEADKMYIDLLLTLKGVCQ